MIRISIRRSTRTTLAMLLLAATTSYGNNTHPQHDSTDVSPAPHADPHAESMEAALDQLTRNLPPNDLRLLEPYLDVALARQRSGDHEAAIAALEQALHIHRIHHGLFDPGQLTVVEKLLESHHALGRWQQVDDLHHYRFHVAREQIPAGTDTRMAALLELTRWKLHAAEQGLLDNPLHGTHEVAELHRRELQLLPPDAPDDQVALHHVAIADMELAQARQKLLAPFGGNGGFGIVMPSLGLHGPLQLVEDGQGRAALIEDFDLHMHTEHQRIDTLDVSRHLYEFKSSIARAHKLAGQQPPTVAATGQLLGQSIQRSIDDYNGFVASVVLGRF